MKQLKFILTAMLAVIPGIGNVAFADSIPATTGERIDIAAKDADANFGGGL